MGQPLLGREDVADLEPPVETTGVAMPDGLPRQAPPRLEGVVPGIGFESRRRLGVADGLVGPPRERAHAGGEVQRGGGR